MSEHRVVATGGLAESSRAAQARSVAATQQRRNKRSNAGRRQAPDPNDKCCKGKGEK